MKKRKIILSILSAVALSATMAGCGAKKEDKPKEPAKENVQEQKSDTKTLELNIFTLDELSKYNGKDGEKAYIAIDGIVYDVTDHPAWKDGGHNGFEAGKDLTDAIKNESPHGISKLENLTVVGALEEK